MDISDSEHEDIEEIMVTENPVSPVTPTPQITVSPPPTILLQPTVLKEVCDNIFNDLMELVNSRNQDIHLENYEGKWKNLRSVVNRMFNDLQ